jgi:2,4-dienoyl-CoA reductase-like NADH-dependent reductase (Old Yellow Enzyme family)
MNDAIPQEVAARYKHVLEPLRVGSVVLPNRIARAPHQTTFAQGGVTEQLIAYHVARAKGGVGLTVLETASVHPSSPVFLDLTTDHVIEGLGQLVNAVRPYGMKLFQQLWHGGSQAQPLDGSPPWSASALPAYLEGVLPGAMPISMTQGMIDEVVSGFADAARRSIAAGIDGLEVHAAHGYLLMQFLSPATNIRTDAYGGDLDNRMRFLVDVLRAIRHTAGNDVPLGIRLSSTDFFKDGLGPAEISLIISQLERAGLIDYISLSVGTYFSPHRIFGLLEKPGYQLDLHQEVLSDRKVPRLVTGRFVTLDDAEAALESGRADIVSMVRATIADPDHVRKTLLGQRPRPCIACNTCVAGLIGGQLRCAVNATVGFESSRVDDLVARADRQRRVLIVGAGPGGLEAARMAARRGHDVTCIESRDAIGGQMLLGGGVSGREDLLRYLEWMQREVERSGVQLLLSTKLTESFLQTHAGFDQIIVAAGPIPRNELFQLAAPRIRPVVEPGGRVLSSWDVLRSAPAGSGARAVVLDDVGYAEGFCVALKLIERGWAVTVVSRLGEVAQHLYATNYSAAARQKLYASRGFEFLPYAYIDRVAAERMQIQSLVGSETRCIDADLLVPVLYGQPQSELVELARRHAGTGVQVIGDALAPHRYLKVAISEGNAAALSIA